MTDFDTSLSKPQDKKSGNQIFKLKCRRLKHGQIVNNRLFYGNGKSKFAVENAFVSFLHHVSNSKQNYKTSIFIQKRRNSNPIMSTS